MALRSLVLIALVGSVFIVTCAAADTGSYSFSETGAVSQSRTRSKTRDNCAKVKRCPANEEFSYCTQNIGRAQFCSQSGQSLRCPEDPSPPCKEGCVCKEGYLRNVNGTCIPASKCSTNCASTEVLDDCPVDCASDYCPTSDGETSICGIPDQDNCPKPVCKCRFNYRRVDNGSCVPTRDCPPFDCSVRPNEEYVPCPPLCPTDDCSQATPTGECPPRFGNILIVLPCNPKCRCKKGYWRKHGICVPYKDCPNICPANEEYSECTQIVCRAQNCTQRGKPVPCPMIEKGSCKTGCVCKEGYLRLKNGTCVVEDQCGCGPNEVLDTCPSDCPADYCPTSEEDNEKCPSPDPCPEPTCKCAFNYRRNEYGYCIPTEECPPFDCSTKPNEIYIPCPPLCPSDACGMPRVTGRCPFRIGIRLECNPKCQCKDGYGRSNGKCVPFTKCPNLCPINEVYSPCTQAVCRPQNCTNTNGPVACPRVAAGSCIKGCVCKKNYYRNQNGTCVSDEECQNEQGPLCPYLHEKYMISNIPYCPYGDLCKSMVIRIPPCTEPEGPGCVCDSGYFRINKTSHCIPMCECPEMANSPDCE